jgi:hypothetical protein
LSSHPTKNGNYGVCEQLKISIKQSEDERLPPVQSGIAQSYPASLILCICSELAVGTRESLVCFFITLVFFFFGLFQVTQILVNKTPPKKEKKHQEKKPQTKFETFWEWMEGYGTPSSISRQIPRQQNGEDNNQKRKESKACGKHSWVGKVLNSVCN